MAGGRKLVEVTGRGFLERCFEGDAHTEGMGDDGTGVAGVVGMDKGGGAREEATRRDGRQRWKRIHHISEDVACSMV
jgi:hypothetical protein